MLWTKPEFKWFLVTGGTISTLQRGYNAWKYTIWIDGDWIARTILVWSLAKVMYGDWRKIRNEVRQRFFLFLKYKKELRHKRYEWQEDFYKCSRYFLLNRDKNKKTSYTNFEKANLMYLFIAHNIRKRRVLIRIAIRIKTLRFLILCAINKYIKFAFSKLV